MPDVVIVERPEPAALEESAVMSPEIVAIEEAIDALSRLSSFEEALAVLRIVFPREAGAVVTNPPVPVMTASRLNAKQRALWSAFEVAPIGAPLRLNQLADIVSWTDQQPQDVTQSRSWVRNSLRKLQAVGLVVRCDSGTYARAK